MFVTERREKNVRNFLFGFKRKTAKFERAKSKINLFVTFEKICSLIFLIYRETRKILGTFPVILAVSRQSRK